MRERRVNPRRREQFEEARRELARRLGVVCRHFSRDELEALTARMTRVRLKYEVAPGIRE